MAVMSSESNQLCGDQNRCPGYTIRHMHVKDSHASLSVSEIHLRTVKDVTGYPSDWPVGALEDILEAWSADW